MRYVGWIVCLVLAVALYIGYKVYHEPIRADLERLKDEIAMWENVLKKEKGMIGDRNRFAVDRFFKDDKLTPYGEVEILRKFEPTFATIDIYISAPHPFTRACGVITFLAEQGFEYKQMSFVVEIDSVERFEYQFSR